MADPLRVAGVSREPWRRAYCGPRLGEIFGPAPGAQWQATLAEAALAQAPAQAASEGVSVGDTCAKAAPAKFSPEEAAPAKAAPAAAPAMIVPGEAAIAEAAPPGAPVAAAFAPGAATVRFHPGVPPELGVADADQDDFSALARQQLRRQVRSELGERGAARDAAVFRAPAVEAGRGTLHARHILDDVGLDRARLAAGQTAAADHGGLPSRERQLLRRQVRDELFTAQPAAPEPQARAGPRSPACEAALSSLERRQLRRQVRLELQTVPALPAADVLPVAAEAPPGPGPAPDPQVQALPDPIALKAEVEAVIGASADIVGLNALCVGLELRLGLPEGALVAHRLEVKTLASAWMKARVARGSADLD